MDDDARVERVDSDRSLDSELSHESWAAEIARREAKMEPPEVAHEPRPLPPVEPRRRLGAVVPDFIDGVRALRMCRKSLDFATDPDAANLLLRALSDQMSGVSATVPGGRTLRPEEWARFSIDTSRRVLVGSGGAPEYPGQSHLEIWVARWTTVRPIWRAETALKRQKSAVGSANWALAARNRSARLDEAVKENPSAIPLARKLSVVARLRGECYAARTVQPGKAMTVKETGPAAATRRALLA